MCCSCTWEQRENINSCWIFIWFGTSNYYNWSCANASRQLSLLPSSISKVMRPEEFLQFKPWLLRAWFGESYEGCFCKNLCLNFHRPDVWLLWPTLNKKKKEALLRSPSVLSTIVCVNTLDVALWGSHLWYILWFGDLNPTSFDQTWASSVLFGTLLGECSHLGSRRSMFSLHVESLSTPSLRSHLKICNYHKERKLALEGPCQDPFKL